MTVNDAQRADYEVQPEAQRTEQDQKHDNESYCFASVGAFQLAEIGGSLWHRRCEMAFGGLPETTGRLALRRGSRRERQIDLRHRLVFRRGLEVIRSFEAKRVCDEVGRERLDTRIELK